MIEKLNNYRNRRLLNLAHRVNECQMKTPDCISYVANGCEPIHSDHQEHGKGMGIKSADDKHAAGCHQCHIYYGEKMKKEDKFEFICAAIKRTMDYYRNHKWLVKIGYAEK